VFNGVTLADARLASTDGYSGLVGVIGPTAGIDDETAVTIMRAWKSSVTVVLQAWFKVTVLSIDRRDSVGKKRGEGSLILAF